MPVKAVSFIVLLAALTLFGGCKSSCRQLSEKLCDCAANSNDRTNCLSLASSKEAAVTLTEQQNAYCETLLPQCDCRLIDTTPGKIRCGLAYPLAPPAQ